MALPLSIAAVGMVTSLGDDTPRTITALAEGKRPARKTPLVDLAGDPIVGAFALPVSRDIEGATRALALARPALIECRQAAGPMPGATALFVCGPASWGSFAQVLAPAFAPIRDENAVILAALAAEIEARDAHVPEALRFWLPRGHAAGVLALQRAAELFDSGDAAQVILVGLDHRGDRATLERLDLSGALRSRRSPAGFLPGEAAAVLCVRPATRGAPGPLVCGLRSATESEAPTRARALTAAVDQALTTWGGDPKSVRAVAVDLNGQRERAKEWSFTATRTLHRHRATPTLLHPADQLGDVGASTVPLLIALLARGAGPRGAALIAASSADGLRGAVLLDTPS